MKHIISKNPLILKGVYFLVLMDYYSNPLNTFFCEQKKETNKFFPVKICALTTISKDVIYLSHSNSIKKLLNIKEKNFKITKVCDEDIKGITTKVVYAVASKENTKCPCCANKLIKNGFKIINIKILKASQYNTLLKISKQRYICKSCNKSFSHKLKLVNDNCSISNDVKLAIKKCY